MVGTSTPFENRTKSTIWNPDMSGFRIPTVKLKLLDNLSLPFYEGKNGNLLEGA